MTAKHMSTGFYKPWILKHDKYADYRIMMDTPNGSCVAHLTDVDRDIAKEIVTACNAYEANEVKIKILRNMLNRLIDEVMLDEDVFSKLAPLTLEQARKALKLAGEEV